MLEGIPTVTSPEQGVTLAGDIVKAIDSEFEVGSWTPIAYTDPDGRDIQLREKSIDGCPYSCVLSTVTINCPAKKVFQAAATDDASIKKKVDKDLEVMEIVMKLDDNTQIGYFQYASPAMMVAKRDFLVLRGGGVDAAGVYRSWGHSVNFADNCDKGFVRGFSRTMWRITPKGDDACVAEYLALVDPKGWIPAGVVNSFKTSAGGKMQRMRALCES
eukprot:PhF_6_TR9475/c0_g1_i1/m.14791